MKKIFVLTTLFVLFAVVSPVSAKPTIEKQCQIWFRRLAKIPTTSPKYNKLQAKFDSADCGRVLDRLALVSLYESTDGDNWDNTIMGFQPWLIAADHCDWFGVFCQDGRISTIEFPSLLYGNNLNGSIPSEIGYLSNLHAIDLTHEYNLTGSIPPEFGNLTQLEMVNLQHVALGGPIPDKLRNLTKLRAFFIYSSDNSLCVSTQELLEFFQDLGQNYAGPTNICTQ